ncbi:hypothetical protein [Tabrizicola sp. BL-A-41-H6]|uniref:hypothetical protein n=1 Tax=Tabrizicola sp. BL-A-41-H6 TaxID=3421107 RepID=UPI003D67ABCC
MRGWVVALALWPGVAGAEEWRALSGAEIRSALSARVLQYEDAVAQDFFADGRTLYGESWGRWRVEGDAYCSIWPPSDRWDCLAVEARGIDVRFLGDGEPVVGKYADLQ